MDKSVNEEQNQLPFTPASTDATTVGEGLAPPEPQNCCDENNNTSQIRAIPPLALAYIGDCVFELCVREYLLTHTSLTVEDMNKKAREYVTAVRQARMYEAITNNLTDCELSILRRGRNAHSNCPKSASVSEYRRATGLEALFGYLYLSGENERIKELFEICKAASK